MYYNNNRVVRKFYLKSVLLLSFFFAVSNSYGQGLSGIPGLALWLRADSGVVTTGAGDSVTQWTDLSPSGANATTTPGSRPTLTTDGGINNKPTLLFNGSTDFLSGPQIAAFNNNDSSCATYMFLVAKGNTQTYTGSVLNAGLFTIGAQLPGLLWERSSGLGDLFVSNSQADQGGDYVFSTSAIPSGGATFPYKILEVRKSESNNVALYANCLSAAQRSDGAMDGAFANSTYNVGWAQGTTNYFSGEIAELIVFISDTCLSAAQIQQVETYLGTKYSPTVHIGPRDTTITHGLCALPLTAPTGFVSYLWSTGATTNTISVSTSGTYSVIIKDGFGALQYDTSTVTFPSITLNASTTLCLNGHTELVPHISSFSGYTFLWSNSQTTDSISVTTGGNYTVTVKDANSCTVATNTEVVTVDAFSSTVSLGPAATLCGGNTLGLLTPATGWSRLQFHWSTASTDSIIWISAPSATYSVTVTDTVGCSGSASVSITVNNTAPHVNFTTTPVCQGLVYSPDNLSDSVNVHYQWAFGDGGTDTARYPTHLYHAAGIFYVKLTVSNSTTGCVSDSIIPLTVNALPSAAFQSTLGCTGHPFTFTNLSSPAPGQTISAYKWQFGDFTNPQFDTSSSRNPTYTYNTVDTYQVTLVDTQANGCVASASGSIIIQSSNANPGVPLLMFPPNGSISASDSVTFGWVTSSGAVYYNLLISPDPSFSVNDSEYNTIYSNQLTVVLPPNQTYFWRVTAVNPCGNATFSPTDTVTLFNPANLGNVAFWVRADSGVIQSGGNVSKWVDQVTSNNDTAVSAGAAQPTFLTQVPLLNYKPSIKFNGTSSYMTGSAIQALGGLYATNSNSISIFIVARADGALGSEPQGIFTIGGLNSGMWCERGNGFTFINYYNNDPPGSASVPPILSDPTAMPSAGACPYHVYQISKQYGSYVNLDTNGVFDASDFNTLTTGFFIDSNYNIGHCAGTDPYGGSPNPPYGYLNGEIAEILIYNTALNSGQVQQVNGYIFNKYAPPVNLGPDIVQTYSLCPVTLKTGNRFVSYKWNTGATSDTLNVTQGGTYTVTAVDVFNRISIDSVHVTLPYQGSSPDTEYICHGDTGQILQLISNPGQYTYTWYDSTSPSSVVNLSINADVIHPYSAGYYYTKIADSSHCFITTRKVPVIIDNFYSAQLLPLYDTLCKNGTLVTNTVPYVIDSFLWQPLNDTTSAPYIPASGTYYLSTVDNHGCRNFDSSQITTRAQAPVTNFTVPNYCLSNTTYFTDSSFAAPGDFITSYLWNYGGGIPSTDTTVNGQTSYRINYGYGNYTVTLKVTTDSGCVGLKTRHITILPSPNAGYTDSANNSVYPYILCAGSNSSAQFTDTSAAVGGSPITQRFWKFNDQVSPNSGSSIQYSFPAEGVYNVTLEVVNALGCADSISQQITVNPAFAASFGFNDQCLGDSTTFTDLTQSLSVVSRIWKFRENGGDGPYAYSQVAQVVFGQPGVYDVELQLENAIGCLSTVDKLVKIVQKPTAAFSNLISCVNQLYTPLNNSVANGDTLVKWEWNIGGHLFNTPSPSLVFNTIGPESVQLIVTSSDGCVDSVTQVTNVAPVPDALFSFTPLYGTAPLQVTFTNRSTGANSYVWDFGDGNSVTTASPFINPPPYTYTQNGNYNVVLYAYNSSGCYDSLSRLITVIPTNLDLAIELVNSYSVPLADGGQLVTLTAYISNLGTRIITSAQLYATLGGVGIMEQNWSGYLLSGQTVLDTFPAQFVVPQGASNTFVCVTATNVNGGETETDTTNNQNCTSLSGGMQLAGPSPNPAITESELGIIMPKAGTVYVSVIDEMGAPVVPEASFSLPVGRTNYTIPVGRLMGGEYFIRVRYNDDIEVRKFVVR